MWYKNDSHLFMSKYMAILRQLLRMNFVTLVRITSNAECMLCIVYVSTTASCKEYLLSSCFPIRHLSMSNSFKALFLRSGGPYGLEKSQKVLIKSINVK